MQNETRDGKERKVINYSLDREENIVEKSKAVKIKSHVFSESGILMYIEEQNLLNKD